MKVYLFDIILFCAFFGSIGYFVYRHLRRKYSRWHVKHVLNQKGGSGLLEVHVVRYGHGSRMIESLDVFDNEYDFERAEADVRAKEIASTLNRER